MISNRYQLSRRAAIGRAGSIVGAAFAGGDLSPKAATATAAEASASVSFVYCLNTSTIRGQNLGLVKEIELAAKAGFQAIEPWTEAIARYAKGGGSLKELKQRIADVGVTIEDAIGFPEWLVEDDARRAKGLERAKYEMDLVAQIGGKRLAMPPAGATNAPVLDLGKVAERYRAVLELGDQMGIIPQLELWGFSKNLGRLGHCVGAAIETGHPKACVLVDVFHLYKSGSSVEALRFLAGGLLQVFHMNDYPADPPREKINDSYRVFPGDGTAPLTQILRNLASTAGQKVLSLELFNRKYWEQDAADVLKTGLVKMKAAVQKALA